MDSDITGCRSPYVIALCPSSQSSLPVLPFTISSINKKSLKEFFFLILEAQAPLRLSIKQISVLTMGNMKSYKNNDKRLSPYGFLQ